MCSVAIVLLFSSVIADASCDFTFTAGSPWESTLQTALDGHVAPGLFTVCVEPTAFTGCGDGLTMISAGGGPVRLVGLSNATTPRPTLDCEGSGRAVNIMNETADVLIENLEIKNGAEATLNSFGGAVRVIGASKLELRGVAIESCGDSALYAEDGTEVALYNCSWLSCSTLDNGGAIRAEDNVNVTCDGCLIESCGAYYGGGMYFANGVHLGLVSSTIMDNTAEYGGGMWSSDGSPVSLFFVNFTENIAYSYGGGLYSYGNSPISLSSSIINGNTAYVYGGGVFSDSHGPVSMFNTTITGNSAYDGAGMYTGLGSDTTAFMCHITSNVAGDDGGGLSSFYNKVAFSNSYIEGNNAVGDGGGVEFYGDGAVYLNQSSISRNSAELGGGLYADYYKRIFIAYCVFTNNSADYGGGLYSIDSSHISMSDCLITNNTADFGGGLLSKDDSHVSMSDCHIFGNTADYDGAGLLAENNCLVTMNDSIFLSNSAVDSGGAIHVSVSSRVTVEHTIVSNNTADSAGGLYCGSASPASLYHSFVVNNDAGLSGGGIYCQSGSPLAVSHSTIYDNSAGLSGGGLFIAIDSPAFITNSTVSGNRAEQEGGGMHLRSDSPVTVSGSVLAANVAGGDGGGVYAELACSVAISNTSVTRNIAEGHGGGVVVSDVGLVVTGSEFVANTAGGIGGAVFAAPALICILNDSSYVDNAASLASGVFSLLGDSLRVKSCMFEGASGLLYSILQTETVLAGVGFVSNDTESIVFILGSATVVVTDSSITAHRGVALEMRGVEYATVTRTLVGSDTGVGLLCVASDVLIDNSSMCSSGVPMQCSGCAISGDLSECVVTPLDCFDTCEVNNFCVEPTPFSTAPNLGCPRCDYACWQGDDDCNSSSTQCWDTADGDYDCVCITGFRGKTLDGYSCFDVDECAVGAACVGNAFCVNTYGSFVCDCPPGFEPDGNSGCVDIDECASYPCYNRACINEVGNFTCGDCLEGYYLFAQSSVCLPCPPSRYVYSEACVACPANTYTNGTNSGSCRSCPFPLAVLPDQTGCYCPVSSSIDDSSGVCDCALGYQRVQNSLCQLCPVGKYGESNGVCTPCPLYSTTMSTGATSVSDCLCSPGFVLNATANECVRVCGPGYFVAEGECVKCPAGTFKNETSVAEACAACPVVGSTTTSSGSVSEKECVCPLGKEVELIDTVETCTVYCAAGFSRPLGVTCEVCGGSSYSDEPNQAECTRCPDNTATRGQATSIDQCTCKVGFFHPERKVGEPCDKCPDGARCRGGQAKPTAEPGFFPVGDNQFAACSPPEACKAGGKCAEGYRGDRCAKCAKRFFRVSGECQKCGEAVGTAIAGLIALLLVGCAYAIYSNLGEQSGAHMTAAIIGVNAVQVLSKLGRLSIQWPYSVQFTFNFASVAGVNLELMGPECFSQNTRDSPFFLRFYMTMGIPVVGLTVFLIYYVALRLLIVKEYITKFTKEELTRAVLQAISTMGLFLYLPLSGMVFEFFDCVPVQGLDIKVLDTAPDVTCFQGGWNAHLPVAIFFVFLVPVGVPALFGGLLFYARSTLDETTFGLRYGFLTIRYKPQFFFYELVVLVRKLLIVVAITFIASSAYIKAGAVFFVVGLSSLAHRILEPFEYRRHNRYDSFCHFSLYVIIIVALTYQDETTSYSTVTGFLVMLLVLLMSSVPVAGALDMVLLREDMRILLGDRFGLMDKALERQFTGSRVLKNVQHVGADLDLDENGLDADGRDHKILAEEEAYLQRDSGREGLDRWVALGSGVTVIRLCFRYASYDYFFESVGPDDKVLLDSNIGGDSRYEVVGPRTHELVLTLTDAVAITFRTVDAAASFVAAMSSALPPDLGLLVGSEQYANDQHDESVSDGEEESSEIEPTLIVGENGTLKSRDDDISSAATVTGGTTVAVPTTPAAARREAEARDHLIACLNVVQAGGLSLPITAPEEWEYVRDIGKGGFGAVKLYRWGGLQLAVKINTHPAEVQNFVLETVQLARLDHPNIIRLTSVCPELLAIGTEFMAGGDVSARMKGSSPPGYSERLGYLYEAAKGLVYMHEEHNMAHRDIKPMNILIGEDGAVKLGDLGLAGDAELVKYGYTKRYAAPELIGRYAAGTLASDVYAFGVTIFEVLTGQRAFDGVHREDSNRQGKPHLYPTERGTTRYIPTELGLGEQLADELCDVVERGTWAPIPDDRPSMRYVLCVLARIVASLNPSHTEAVRLAAAAGMLPSSGACGYGTDYGVNDAEGTTFEVWWGRKLAAGIVTDPSLRAKKPKISGLPTAGVGKGGRKSERVSESSDDDATTATDLRAQFGGSSGRATVDSQSVLGTATTAASTTVGTSRSAGTTQGVSVGGGASSSNSDDDETAVGVDLRAQFGRGTGGGTGVVSTDARGESSGSDSETANVNVAQLLAQQQRQARESVASGGGSCGSESDSETVNVNVAQVLAQQQREAREREESCKSERAGEFESDSGGETANVNVAQLLAQQQQQQHEARERAESSESDSETVNVNVAEVLGLQRQ